MTHTQKILEQGASGFTHLDVDNSLLNEFLFGFV